MSVNWTNPYQARDGEWVCGNIHAHATPNSPCAIISKEELCRAYLKAQQDFLSISDHMQVTSPTHDGLTMLPGLEWNSRSNYMANRSLSYYHHIGVYSPDTSVLETAMECRQPEILCREIDAERSVLVANHPNWLSPEHYDQYTLHRLSAHLDGLEIYNAAIELEEGEADATGRWDRLLTLGAPLLGFAGDDSHATTDVGKAWMSARVAEKSPEAVFQALKDGNFYCTTGVTISDIGRKRDGLFISVEEKSRIRVIGSGGAVLFETIGNEARWDFGSNGTHYARFHVAGRNWDQAWSQPFFKIQPNGK